MEGRRIGKSKITIKPFRNQVQVSPDYAATTMARLTTAMKQIHDKNQSSLSFEELYRYGYNMVQHSFGAKLYAGVQQRVREHLSEEADKLVRCADAMLLVELNKVWQDHKLSQIMIRDILMYMDRIYVNEEHLPGVYDMGLLLFRETIVEHMKLRPRIRACLLDCIHRERRHEIVDRSLLRSIVQLLLDLGIQATTPRDVYVSEFEQPFLAASAEFFHAESVLFLEENSCGEYLNKVEIRLQEELDRVNTYLDPGTESCIQRVVEYEMLEVHMQTLVEMPSSGLVVMLQHSKQRDLRRMYELFGRVSGGRELIRSVMAEFVRESGMAIVQEPELRKDPIAYVDALLALKDKFDDLMSGAFFRDPAFQAALAQSFEAFVNAKDTRSAEFISLYLDDKLKKGLRGVSEDEVEVLLEKVVMLFRHLQEKDLFEKYYKQHLAKRLLLGRSVSDDAERSMISKLKLACGYQFTSKLEGMFKDMRVSEAGMQAFHAFCDKAQITLPLTLSVSVLSTGAWPTTASEPCALPAVLQHSAEVFEKYYLSSHNGRRLTWQTALGTAELRAEFPRGRKELSVSTYQAAILLLFNDSPSLTYPEILAATRISEHDLKRNLQSLACAKYKVLSKEPMSREINAADVFSVNADFACKLFRVKISTVAAAKTESDKERQATQKRVDADRRQLIDAAIVRTMKARKKLEHNNLVAEVTKQLQSRFVASPVVIKKQIESLLEREYLERSADDRRVYNYLA